LSWPHRRRVKKIDLRRLSFNCSGMPRLLNPLIRINVIPYTLVHFDGKCRIKRR
jgi:hypothetical protein